MEGYGGCSLFTPWLGHPPAARHFRLVILELERPHPCRQLGLGPKLIRR